MGETNRPGAIAQREVSQSVPGQVVSFRFKGMGKETGDVRDGRGRPKLT